MEVETARHGLRLMRVDEKATTRSPNDTRRTIGSENKNVSRALLRAFVKEVEIFPDDGLIKYAIPRGTLTTSLTGALWWSPESY